LLLISTNLSRDLDEFHSYKELSGHFIKILFSINSKSLLRVLDGFNSYEEYSRTVLGRKTIEKIKILVASYSSREFSRTAWKAKFRKNTKSNCP
jgi:hypothetical protein